MRIWRHGEQVVDEVCAEPEDAVAMVAHWADLGLSAVEVDDLSAHHRPGQVLEPDLELDVDVVDPDEERPPD